MKKSIVAIAILSITASLSTETFAASNNPIKIFNGHRFYTDMELTRKDAEEVSVSYVSSKFDKDMDEKWKKAIKNAIIFLNDGASQSNSYLRYKYYEYNNLSSQEKSELNVQIFTYNPCTGNNNRTVATTLPGQFNKNSQGEKILATTICINPTLRGSDKEYIANNSETRRGIMMHELLHAAGFAHTGVSEKGTFRIPGTSNPLDWHYANKSILEPGSKIEDFRSFLSMIDRKAIGIMYPNE